MTGTGITMIIMSCKIINTSTLNGKWVLLIEGLCLSKSYSWYLITIILGVCLLGRAEYLKCFLLEDKGTFISHSQCNALWLSRGLESLATLTLGSSKINQHCWRFHGSGIIAAPQIIGLISFCTGMHHEYFFEVVNVLSCSPFMFENTENKQLNWRIRHSHLASTLFHSLIPWWVRGESGPR